MKTPNAPLEKKRPLLFLAGLLIALSVTLVSFEWRTPYKDLKITERGTLIEEEPIWIPVTLPEARKTVPKPDLPKPEPITDQFELTDNRVEDKVSETKSSFEAPIEFHGMAQKSMEPDVEDEDLKIWKLPSVMPEFCKGEAAMFKFLGEALTYPEIPRVNGISGVVYVQFVVGKDGKVRDAQVVRPIDPWLDAEALRVARLLDCFVPGKQAGRNVDVYFILPVRFALTR